MSFPVDRRRDLAAIALIALVFLAGCALVGPLRDVPVMDDWVYAWSVEHLLQTGRLHVLDISSIHPLLPILWGALVARIAGFSFGALRLTTAAVGAGGCVFFYLTLREVAVDRPTSLIAALAVALAPVYFALSFSFMTDVPLVAMTIVALFYTVSAIHRREPARLWAASVAALAAFLVRPIAVAIPLAAIPALPWRDGWRDGGRRWMPPVAATLVAMIAAWVVMNRTMGALDYASGRIEQMQWLFDVPVRNYAAWNLQALYEATFPLAPVLLLVLGRRRRWPAAAAGSIVVLIVARLVVGRLPSPVPDWQTWSLQEISTRTMMEGHLTPSRWSLHVAPVLRGAGAVVITAFAIGAAAAWRRARDGDPAAAMLLALGVLNAALINLLWFYNDRYYVVFAPTVAYAAAAAAVPVRPAKWIAAGVLALWAIVAVSGTRDMLDVNAAAVATARELEATGVPPWEIDAGYPANGWRLYAHPERLPSGADRRYDVPFVTSQRETAYMIANLPVAGYDVVRIVPLHHAWWQVTDRLYVLHRRASGGEGQPSTQR